MTALLIAAVPMAAVLAVGYFLGRASTTRRCGRLLRDVCHYDAANLIDPPRNPQ